MPDTNEAFARVKIDRALEDSGWNLLDPHQVRLEVAGKARRADYVLGGPHGPVCVLEAKKEDADPYDAREQARGYAENLRVPFVILSNGREHWFWNVARADAEEAYRIKGYVKQGGDTSKLVPGAKELLAILVWMFHAYDEWHWGYHRIAQDLNLRNVPSPDGCRWTLKTVRSILFNPIYLGIEVRHRWTGALYNKLSEKGPVAVYIDQDKLEKEERSRVPHTERPREEWKLVDVPELKDILPIPLRELATERIMKQFDLTIPPHPKKGVPLHTGAARSKHLDSPFILTSLLCSKQTGHWMRGETANRKMAHGRKLYRYYFDGGAAVFAEKGLNIRRIPAEPVEQAVLGVIQQVLADAKGIETMVRRAVSALANEEPPDQQQRTALQQESEAISLRLRQAYKLLGGAGAKPARCQRSVGHC